MRNRLGLFRVINELPNSAVAVHVPDNVMIRQDPDSKLRASSHEQFLNAPTIRELDKALFESQRKLNTSSQFKFSI